MLCCFFFNDTATTEIYTLSLHDALPISSVLVLPLHHPLMLAEEIAQLDLQSAGRIDVGVGRGTEPAALRALQIDADSTRERFAHRSARSEEHTSELQSQSNLVCRLLLEKKNT